MTILLYWVSLRDKIFKLYTKALDTSDPIDEVFKKLFVIGSATRHQYIGALFNRAIRSSCKSMLRKSEQRKFHWIQLNSYTFREKKN